MVDKVIIEARLKEFFTDAKEVKAVDLTGGGDHWQVSVTSAMFNNKSMVEQHKLVYAALHEWINKEIHALAIQTYCV